MSTNIVDLATRPHRQMVGRYLALWGRYEMLGLPTAHLAEVIAWHEQRIREAEGYEVSNQESRPE